MFDKEQAKRGSFFFLFFGTNSHFFKRRQSRNGLRPIRRFDVVQLSSNVRSMILRRPFQRCCSLCLSTTLRASCFQAPSPAINALLKQLTRHRFHSRYESADPPAPSMTETTAAMDAAQVSSAVLKSGARSSILYSGAPS